LTTSLLVLVQYMNVTDTQTDGHHMTAKPSCSRAAKIRKHTLQQFVIIQSLYGQRHVAVTASDTYRWVTGDNPPGDNSPQT